MVGRRKSGLGRRWKASFGGRTCEVVKVRLPLRMVRSSSAGSEKRSVCSLLFLLLLGMHPKTQEIFLSVFASNKILD